MEQQRIGVVYLLRDIQSGKPFYIGSTIGSKQQKLDHSPNNRCKYTTKSAVKHYIRKNNIQHQFEQIETIIGTKSEIISKIKTLEQRYILKSKHPLINKKNPLPIITKYKKKYPWLSNKSLLKLSKTK